jgi:3-deoxy-7-phosphoheptulonate synthase
VGWRGGDAKIPGVMTTPLVDRSARPEGTIVRVGALTVGGPGVPVFAGPCAVESREQLEAVAAAVVGAGAAGLRGGAFKGRTSPYSFQGLGEEGLELLVAAGRRHRVPVVTEVLDATQVEACAGKVDLLQVGARSMQNYPLLRAVGKSGRPVLLKRAPAATVEEWLHAAEHVLAEGNPHVILCERGIRTFEPSTRFTLDLSAVAVVKQRTHLPVVVDPSHAAGARDLVPALGRAALAAGADGLLVEVHTDPARALSDGPQALTPEMFVAFLQSVGPLLAALGRRLQGPGGREA